MNHGFLIDMDGVIYRGGELIPGADHFIRELITRDISFLVLTNNSQRTRRDIAMRLSRMAREECGLTTDETVMIGDTMDTDIVGGLQMGYKTVLVLTGTTSRQDLAEYAFQPDVIIESIAHMADTELFSLSD